jgi:hypothetical protein
MVATMPTKSKTSVHFGAIIARLAWLAAFVLPLVLAGLLLAVSTTFAAPAEPTVVSLPLEEEFEFEAEESELEESECEAAEEELGEEELGELEVEQICEDEDKEGTASAHGALPEECLLKTFRSEVTAYPSRSQLQLAIHYTTFEPTNATILYGFAGSPHLGTAKRHLGGGGVVHLNKRLSESQAKKIGSAHNFTVQIHIPTAPNRCMHYYSSSLNAKHVSQSRIDFSPRRSG